jgi:UDP:flavonoid glycosyltransferase YjiC (YdhE family)
VFTSHEKLTASHISIILDEVLNDPTYHTNARRMQKAIGNTNGLSVACDLIEESLGVKAGAS